MANQRTLTSILGNSQRLDGGAMFGNAPKALWQRWSEPDDRNRIALACRALLVRDGERKILLETGIGSFFPPRLKERYGVVEDGHVLLESLRSHGVAPEDVDVVVLSHLHFDHAGGLLSPWREDGSYELVFPRARFLVGRQAWERALAPHDRDRASFIPELVSLLENSGRLELVDAEHSATLGQAYRFWFSDGHTPGMMHTEVEVGSGPVFFAADLIPGCAWVHLPITMGYDRYPEKLIEEKRQVLERLVARGGYLFYTHDATVALSAVRVDNGRFSATEPIATLDGWS